MDNNKCKFCDEYKILKSYSMLQEEEKLVDAWNKGLTEKGWLK